MFLKKYSQQARQEVNIQPSEKPVKGANIQRAMENGKLWEYRVVEGGGKLGEPIKPLCPGTRCQLDFEGLHSSWRSSASWDPKDKEGKGSAVL